MKKIYSLLLLLFAAQFANSQSTRMCLYEEFTGETCPPCAATNPGLNALLASPTNTPKVIALKWQVPIPSAPTNTWSLYRTNKAEIDWRYRSTANGGYGYAISSAPSGKMDGQNVTVFGASSNHPANMTSGHIATAQSYTTPFSISLNRAWSPSGTAVDLTITITASSAFNSVGTLKLRTCMVERLIQFSVQPGTNGEKDFEDVVIASFPTTKTGTVVTGMGSTIPSNWTQGQSQTYTLSCPIPSYTRKVTEIAMVCFIQDDGDKKIWQAARAEKQGVPNDAEAVSVTVPSFTCGNAVDPMVTIKNVGITTITDMTITPAIDGVAAAPVIWSGNLAIGATTNIAIGSVTAATGGGHQFSYTITGVSGTDNYTPNNSAKASIYLADDYQGVAVAEDFAAVSFPPPAWGAFNTNNGPAWSRISNVGAYNILPLGSVKYDAFGNSVIGDVDELVLPPLNLAGSNAPIMTFDLSKAFRTAKTDMLEVMVSADCGVTWVGVYSKSDPALASWPTAQTANFLPVTASEWRTDTVSLTGYNVPELLVKFVFTNGNGNNLYLDNINLSQTDPVGLVNYKMENYSVDVYPNPSSGETKVIVNSLAASAASLKLVNSLGQLVFVKEQYLKQGENSFNFDASFLAKGLYSVVIESAHGKVIKKLQVSE